MSRHRFFLTAQLPASPGRVDLPLSAADVHHIARALRLQPGDEIVAVEPEGTAWLVRLTSVGRESCTGEAFEALSEGGFAPDVTLVAGVAKGDRTDLAIEKAVEIGVARVVPVLTERSVVRLTPEKAAARGDRWRRVALAAAKQSQRTFVPHVADPVSLGEIVPVLAETYDVVLVAWEEGADTAPGIGEALDEAGVTSASRIAVVVGPEGGLTAGEVYDLESAGARAVSLGPMVLRAETAGIVAVALAAYELGGLGGRRRG